MQAVRVRVDTAPVDQAENMRQLQVCTLANRQPETKEGGFKW